MILFFWFKINRIITSKQVNLLLREKIPINAKYEFI